ncbi:hypothetical protein Tco_1382779, partial [Tanacetum coccineum]
IKDTTKAQQKALDDDLVAPANRLQIGKCNLRLSSTFKSKEPTLQVVLDALKLTSFYKAFEITAGVPEIYMQEFWICPKLPGQKFEDPPFEEEILSFNRDLRHTGEIKCLSGKTTALESLRLSRAQNLWDVIITECCYVTDLGRLGCIKCENNNSRRTMTCVIMIHQRDDPMFTTIRVISKYHDTQIYGVILPQHLTNQAMLESKAYKTYDAYATGEKIPKQ